MNENANLFTRIILTFLGHNFDILFLKIPSVRS